MVVNIRHYAQERFEARHGCTKCATTPAPGNIRTMERTFMERMYRQYTARNRPIVSSKNSKALPAWNGIHHADGLHFTMMVWINVKLFGLGDRK